MFLLVATTSSFFIAPTPRSFVAFSSPRYTASFLLSSSESSDKEKVEPLKTEQFTEKIQFSDPPAKEEWKDPIAVAAEGKSPFADLFPGGI